MSIAKNSLHRLLIIAALMFAIGLCLQVDNVYADDITYDASVNGDNSVTVTSSEIGSYKVLGTLPEKYRPTTQTWFTQAYSLNLDKGRQTSLCIMPNGQVLLYCWWTGTSQATPCLFTGVYALF